MDEDEKKKWKEIIETSNMMIKILGEDDNEEGDRMTIGLISKIEETKDEFLLYTTHPEVVLKNGNISKHPRRIKKDDLILKSYHGFNPPTLTLYHKKGRNIEIN